MWLQWFCSTYLGCKGSTWNRVNSTSTEEWSTAGEESWSKKLTAVIWNQKQSATWQSLKSCTCTFTKQALRCSSLAPSLLFCFPYFSHFCFCVLWLGALSFSACFLHRSLYVLIVAILGEGENDEENLFESRCARFCSTTQHEATDTWSAWRATER